MECQVCNIRSAIGVCEESQQMICEECSIPCYSCGKRIASNKGHVTKNGHVYCTPCFRERAARRGQRAQQREEEASAERARPGAPPDQAEEEEVFDETMVISRWRTRPPWQWSLILGAAAILAMGLFIVFPSMRVGVRVGNVFLPVASLLLVLPIMALAWGLIGLLGREYAQDPNRNRVFMGLALAVVAFGMAFFALQPPPLPPEMQELTRSRPQFQSEQERAEWRARFLQGEREP